MVEFIDKPEEETDAFEQYFEENIAPLIENENKTKERYRSRFWGYLVSIIFLMSINVLVVLFRALMYHAPISWDQLFLINIAVLALAYIPVYQYNKLPKNDIFDAFLKYYGNWRHLLNAEVKLVHSPIIPEHDEVMATHNIISNYADTTVEIRDTVYKQKNKVVSSGVMVYVTFNEEFNGSLLMFDRRGFYRKNKFPDYEYYNGKTDIPAANYFNIFVSDDSIGQKLLYGLFYENLLDLGDAYAAKHLYLQAGKNCMRIYLEGSELYINNYKLWSRKVDKNRFKRMNLELEKTYSFVQMVKSLMEKK